MVDSLVSATVQILLDKAIALATDRIGLVFGFKKDMESLRGSAAMIALVLADADDKQRHSRAVRLWLKRLEDVAFDAENVLDELNYENLRRKVEYRNRTFNGNKVCFFFSFSNVNIAFRWRMASKVRDVVVKLKTINQEAVEFGLISRFQMAAVLPVVIPATGVTVNRKTDSLVGQNVVGRVNDESRIVEMLLSSSQDVVSVIPIVGMGGLGKTTLAKLVYNNQTINGQFTKKIWVCVSEKFEVIELFKLILESLTRRKIELDNRDTIVQEIRKELEGHKYLLVLDDIWNDNPELWEDFFRSLVGLSTTNGSWCLVTTRLLKVASIVTSNPPYLLGKLSDDDCWHILKEKAVASEEVPEELNSMMKEIVKRCCGLPLSSNVIGGLLRIKKKEEWQSILENWLLNKSGDTNSIEQILKLSFDHLPSPSIKKCFAYCSTFAKDTEIGGDLLIELWMAEGFLQTDPITETSMEEIGENYLTILLESSLLEEKRYSWEVYYTMHDLVHDLALSVSKSDRINLKSGVIDTNYQVRYFEANSFTDKTLKLFEKVSTSLRTLSLQCSIPSDLLPKFRNLHILKLPGVRIRKLPTTIGKLIHLRFIDLSYSTIQTLPESFCMLYNLQTLRILGCYNLKALPKGMSNLISLRHLHYYNYDANFQMPLEMGRLTCLQTLEFFNVGLDKGYQMEELGCLNDLKGKLEIRNLELVKDKEGAEKANLIGKPHLLALEFLWSSTNREVDNCDEDVLEGLQPHPNLQKLCIANFMGGQFPHWFMNLSTRLHKLVRLSLSGCTRCRELPVALGQLPSLQYLEFTQLENIRSIGLSFYEMGDNCSSNHSSRVSRKLFPALEILRLPNMKNLVEWIGPEVDVFPKLEKLAIENCCQLTSAPSYFPSLKELGIWKNDNVSVVKSILSKATRTLWKLTITDMAGLTCVSDIVAAPAGLHQNNYATLPNLKELSLWNCPNLTSTRGCGTCLQRLDLVGCHSLKELPGDMSGLPFLKILEIENCSKIVINPKEKQNLTSLESLLIRGCDGLTYLPGDMLNSCTSLWSLKVYSCPNLVSFSLDLKQTPSLSNLMLMDCPKLKTNMTPKGFGFLTNLRELGIGPFSDEGDSSIDELDWPGLIMISSSSSTLRRLTLVGLPHIRSLPDQLQYLTSLTELSLQGFGGIEALRDWFGNLASLEWLELEGCPKLLYLPSMDAMRRLTKLRCLLVDDCPLLKESCSPQNGPEWPKISHIPKVWIY